MSLNTTAVRIKVTLKDVKPEVMRRLVVPVTLRLDRLHLTLQAAFGWTNSHLFEFHVGEERWASPILTVILALSRSMPARRGSAISFARPALRRSIISMTSATAGTMSSSSKNGSTIRPQRNFPSCLRPPVGVLRKTSAVRRDMPNISTPSATPPIRSTNICASGAPERFDPSAVDRKALEAAVNALSDAWKPRRRATRTK